VGGLKKTEKDTKPGQQRRTLLASDGGKNTNKKDDKRPPSPDISDLGGSKQHSRGVVSRKETLAKKPR